MKEDLKGKYRDISKEEKSREESKIAMPFIYIRSCSFHN